jgi:molecular chaperone DnaK
VEAAIADLKKVLDSGDAEAIKAKTEALNQASHKMSEDLYKAQAAGAQAGPQPGAGPEAGPQGGTQSKGPDMKNAEDADYTVVDDEEKK